MYHMQHATGRIFKAACQAHVCADRLLWPPLTWQAADSQRAPALRLYGAEAQANGATSPTSTSRTDTRAFCQEAFVLAHCAGSLGAGGSWTLLTVSFAAACPAEAHGYVRGSCAVACGAKEGLEGLEDLSRSDWANLAEPSRRMCGGILDTGFFL